MAERLARKPKDEETLDDYLMYLRHLAAYTYAMLRFDGARAIDLGCGTGYGTKLIGEKGKVVGVDQAMHALPAACDQGGVAFCAADVRELPFRNSAFDLATSFQVIEHIWDVHLYLYEAWRVLSDRGTLVISTPNRHLRLLPLERPHNPFHVREYGPAGLRSLLRGRFRHVEILGLHAVSEIETRERDRLHKGRRWYYRHLLLTALGRLPLGERGVAVARRTKRAVVPGTGRQEQAGAFAETQGIEQAFENVYSPEDFWVDNRNLKNALDLIGVCRK